MTATGLHGPPVTAGRRGSHRPPSPGVRTVLRGVGQTLLTAGLVLLLFCVYELYVTNLVAARDQDRLARDLRGAWQQQQQQQHAAAGPPGAVAPSGAAPPVAEGEPFAKLYLPRLSGARPLVVVEGVAVPDLKQGPGHLPGSAQPGEVGNMVLSGHRTTYGAPFGDVGELVPGDAVVVETRAAWFTYRMTDRHVVAPTAVAVTQPVPGRPGVSPTDRLLTLTTCNPKYSARQRLIVDAVLAGTLDKSAGGRPDALPA